MSESSCVGYMRCSGASQVDGDTWDRQIEAIKSCCTRLIVEEVAPNDYRAGHTSTLAAELEEAAL